jgi:hypothetical protein
MPREDNSIPRKDWRKRFPLESFDPRYRILLLKAATERVELTFPNRAAAKFFQTRAYLFRVRAKEVNDPDTNLMHRVRISIYYDKDKNKPARLVLEPADARVNDAFEQIGLKLSERPPEMDLDTDALLFSEERQRPKSPEEDDLSDLFPANWHKDE